MEKQEKIKKLAETLEKSGLAVNPTEAIRKAEEIVATEHAFHKSIAEKMPEKKVMKKEMPINLGADIDKDITVMDLMKEGQKVPNQEIQESEPEKTQESEPEKENQIKITEDSETPPINKKEDIQEENKMEIDDDEEDIQDEEE